MFLGKKLFRRIISRIIEIEKPQGTIYKGTTGIVRVLVQAMRSFPKDLRGR